MESVRLKFEKIRIMKRMILPILLFIATGVFAQNNYLGKNDPRATRTLNSVSSKYKNVKTLTANVSMIVENARGQKLSTQSGELLLKGDKYYLQFGSNVSFSDGVNIYNYDKSNKEIQITKVDPKENTITPQKLFSGFYQKNYLYKQNDDKFENGRTIQEVELTPVDKTQPFFKVLLEIDKATHSIFGARIFEKNGNRYIYNISSAKTDIPIADSKFVYDKNNFPGVEVVDLR